MKATPRAGRSRVEGVVPDGAGAAWLACRVAAPAEGGKASAALRELVAKGLGVPVSSVEVAAGAASRWKRLRVAGDPAALAARLEALLEVGTDRGR